MVSNQTPKPIVLINGFSTSIANHPERLLVEFRRITPSALREAVQNATTILNYIRHPATVNILNELLGTQLGVNSGLYTWRGERVIMIVLNAPQRGQEATPRPEDLVIYEVVIHTSE